MIRRANSVVLALAGGSIALALVLALDLIPFLRGGYGWQWPFEPVAFARFVPLAAATAVYVAGAWWLLGRTQRARYVVAWSILGATILPLLVIAQRYDDPVAELFRRTVSPITTGPHAAAAFIDWESGALRHWPDTMVDLVQISGHMSISPPGLPLFYEMLARGLEHLPWLSDPVYRFFLPYECQHYPLLAQSHAEWASALFGTLMPLWAALTAIPLYIVARRVASGMARQIVLWWPLVPALIMYGGSWNTVFPLLSTVALALFLRGVQVPYGRHWRAGAGWLVLSGLVIGVLSFANLSLLPLLGVLGLITLGYYALAARESSAVRWHAPVVTGLWVGVGLLLPWLLYSTLTGVTFLDIVDTSYEVHVTLDRPYLPWLWLHFWDWVVLTGPVLIVLWLASLGMVRRDAARALIGWALFLVLAVMIFGGIMRGETGRIWLPLTPLALIAAGQALWRAAPDDDQRRSRLWLAVTTGQAALVLALAGTWNVISTELSGPPDAPPPLTVTQATSATFDGALRLSGWDAVTDAQSGTVELTLQWDALERPLMPYWFSALLVGPDGMPVEEAVVWQPFDMMYPATCWAEGAQLQDRVTLALPPDPASGEWWISVAVLSDAAHGFAPVTMQWPSGDTDLQAGIGPVVVP